MALREECKATERQPISIEFLQLLQSTVEQSRDVAMRLENKLSPVMQEDSPVICSEGCPQDTWPPLFHEYRSHLQEISNYLSRINSYINRTEL